MVVAVGAGSAIGVRVLRQRSAARGQPSPDSRPVPAALPLPHDYVADPDVHPAERNNGPRSIVSMAPSITETCCALGLLDRLRGRTRYCTHPPAVADVPDVGALVDPNLELISTLRPDIVLISQNAPRVRDQLAPLKIPFEAITDDSYEGVFDGIRRIGDLCGRPRTARRLVENLREELAILTRAARTQHPRRVLIVYGQLPVPPQSVFVAGPDLFLSRLLAQLGHINAADALLPNRASGELSLEQIVAVNPDVILETGEPSATRPARDVYAAWAGLGPIRAIENRAVRSCGDKSTLVCSPRINLVCYRLARALEEWR